MTPAPLPLDTFSNILPLFYLLSHHADHILFTFWSVIFLFDILSLFASPKILSELYHSLIFPTNNFNKILPSSASCLPLSIFCLLSSVFCLPSFVLCPLSSVYCLFPSPTIWLPTSLRLSYLQRISWHFLKSLQALCMSRHAFCVISIGVVLHLSLLLLSIFYLLSPVSCHHPHRLSTY